RQAVAVDQEHVGRLSLPGRQAQIYRAVRSSVVGSYLSPGARVYVPGRVNSAVGVAGVLDVEARELQQRVAGGLQVIDVAVAVPLEDVDQPLGVAQRAFFLQR